MGFLTKDRKPQFNFGVVENAFPADNRYEVLVFGGGVRLTCRLGETGTAAPLQAGDPVLVATGKSGPIIICKIPVAVPPSDDAQQSLSQILAKAEQDMLSDLSAPQTGTANKPSFQQGDVVPTFGDVLIRSRVSNAMFGIFSDASMILKATNLLFFGLLSRFRAAVITSGRLIVNVIPGFVLKVLDIPKGKAPKVGTEPEQTDERVVRLESSLSSDPTKPADRDVAVEMGGLRDWDDTGTGASQTSMGQKITRGLRMKVRNFGLFESDNELGEMRVTYLQDVREKQGVYQFRINKDEVALSWGDQFMLLNKDGFFIKAKLIGLGGPWAMWDPGVVQGFTHRTSPSDLTPICEWTTSGKSGPGIKFAKNVYFDGDGVFLKHAYFGPKGEPAVLKSFLTQVYMSEMVNVSTHVHGFTPPATVLVSPSLTSLTGEVPMKVNLDVYYS